MGPFMDAVVKVFATHSEPHWSLPWQRKRQTASTSSAFLIEGRRVLTNAHCVEWSTQIQLKRRGGETKYLARLLALGIEFWEGVTPLKLGGLPRLQDAVTVVGYPIGGDTVSVTSGVVSRIEMLAYSHGASELLGVQIDAAINSGNSGGPVFDGRGRCVGVAFQVLRGGHEPEGGGGGGGAPESIGYVVPVPVIEHFLADHARSGRYRGFPSLGVEWQKTESASLRRSLGLEPGSSKGVLVRRVEPTAPCAAVLRRGDVLLAIDGAPVANDGTVASARRGERVSFSYPITAKLVGESAQLTVYSPAAKGGGPGAAAGGAGGGSTRTVSVTLTAPARLVPAHTHGRPPSYYIVGGLLFVPLSVPFLRQDFGAHFDYDAPLKLLDAMFSGMRQAPDEEVVVLSQVLACDATRGFEDLAHHRVATLNGVPITTLRQLVTLCEACASPFLTFGLELGHAVVLDTAAARAATPALLAAHAVPAAASADLQSLLAPAAAAAGSPAAAAAGAAAAGGAAPGGGGGATPVPAAAPAAGAAGGGRKRGGGAAAAAAAAQQQPQQQQRQRQKPAQGAGEEGGEEEEEEEEEEEVAPATRPATRRRG